MKEEKQVEMGTKEFTNGRGYSSNIVTTYSKIRKSEVRNIKKLRAAIKR